MANAGASAIEPVTYWQGRNGSGRSDCLDKLAAAKVQDAVETMLDNNLAISTPSTEVLECK